jgi:transporter family-2 protein
MLSVAMPVLLAVLAGVSIVVQQALNANLRTALSSAAWSGFVSYLVGVLCMALLVIALRDPLPLAGVAARIPWWAWSGDLFGAIFIVLAILLVHRLGAATFIAILVTGQMLASLAFDHYGWPGLTRRPIDLPRLLGGVVLIGAEAGGDPAASGSRSLRPGAQEAARVVVGGGLLAGGSAGAEAGRQRMGAAGPGRGRGRGRGLDRLGRLRLGQMGEGGLETEDRAQAGGGAAEGGVDGVVGAGAARPNRPAGPRGGGAGSGVDDALGQRAGGVAAVAHLVGDEGGGTPVAVGQRQLEHVPGQPPQLAQPPFLGQGLHLGQGREQLLEVGLGQKGVDLALRHGLGAGHLGGRHAGRETPSGAQLAARGGQRRAARGGATGRHADRI